jgi:ribosome-binding factor A
MSDRSIHRFHEALAESIEAEVDFPPGVFVTLVHAEVTGDKRHAKGTISVLPEDKVDQALEALKTSSRYIKESLNKKLRLRRLPELHWTIDQTEEEAAKIENVLNSLKDKGEL